MSLNTLAADKFIELCITYLKGNDEGKQEIGANGLQRVEVGAAEAAQTALVARLKSGSSAGVRSQCAGALAMLGAKATAETIAALEAAASDPDKTVADGAKDALDTLK